MIIDKQPDTEQIRKAHWLKPIKGKGKPQRVLFVDTETNQSPLGNKELHHTLRLGVAKFCRSRRGEILLEQDEIIFYDHETFWEWSLKRFRAKETIYFVSHNLNYDIPILKAFSSFKENGFLRKGEYTSGMVTIIHFEKYFPSKPEHALYIETFGSEGKKPPTAKVLLVDNTNLFAGKLAKWGNHLSLPKLEVDFNGEDEQLITYCRRDVEIMLELWREWYVFLDEHTGGKFGLTISSTAMNAFRSRFFKHWIWIGGDKNTLDLERKSYRGGRTEAFYQGVLNEPLYFVDINSMYPAIMKTKPFPYMAGKTVLNPPLWVIDYHLEREHLLVADVDIEISEPLFPYQISSEDTLINDIDANLQPYLQKTFKNKTCYPIGRFRTTLTTPELKAVMLFGEIHKIHSKVHYRADYLFSDYVDYFYSLRLKFGNEGKELWKQLCKLLLNSLYGKFGQRGYNDKIIGIADTPFYTTITDYNIGTGVTTEIITIDGILMERTRGGEHWNSFPAIASHVTAYARLYLMNYILMAGRENVYYTDTDSLLVNEEGFYRLKGEMDDSELGKLKLEQTSLRGIIHAPKDYHVTGKEARKGVKYNAKRLSRNVYEQERWPKLKGLHREDDPERYVTKTIQKRLSRFIYSGILDLSGRVHPFHLQNH